ncbi:hypothetical protein BGZ99_004091 [Dissophora globulifera]|uniref:Uncharacterized protein n=1 Tax=Dissophora globulifera TaxID=979702 RepID=A0A9P6RIK8_9FUNG|nr:hypothetical protein BGZ99_004091 [Dissophora globulifera]
MTVDDSVVQKLWKLTNELTAQLVFNRNATLELKQQLADLQAKTAQSSGSPPVAPDEAVYNSQEHTDVSLRIANERLMEENSQLHEQLREYERWMEYIMTKFRLQNFAVAQSRKEAMHEAYRMAEQEGELATRLQEENAILQARLAEVGAAARRAINEEYYNTESIIETLEIENQGLREMLGVAAENSNPLATRQPGNRVSFPSTGSYVASSGSDREQSHALSSSPIPIPTTGAVSASVPTPTPTPPVPATLATTLAKTVTTPSVPESVPVMTPARTSAPELAPTVPSSPPAQKIRAAVVSPSTATPTPLATRVPKSTAPASTLGAAGNPASSTGLSSTATLPGSKSTRKKPDEAVGAVSGAKGTTVTTTAVPKRASSINNGSNANITNSSNNSTSNSVSSTANTGNGNGSNGPKSKKPNRKQRS